MVFEHLTELDKQRIRNYISANVDEPTAEIEHILRFWDEAKGKYLFDVLGKQLIVKEQVSFEEGYDELCDKLEVMFCEPKFSVFEQKVRDLFEYGEWTSPERKVYRAIDRLFSYPTLIKNKYENYDDDDEVVEIPLPNGSKYKLQNGCKPMKAIGKIAQAYGIEGFEEFRIAHSLCLNTKKLKGELCLSIHPLDYMTMSDNDCGWDSCMSWYNCGEYKQGTVEMMNSPCVIVGYLTNDDFKFGYCPEGANEEAYRWNSKKWRCLFVVDHDFIISVRQYPYTNENLASAAVSKIAELMGWGKDLKPFVYDYNKYYSVTKPPMVLDEETSVRFQFCTEHMYNDFGAWDHMALLHPGITGNYEVSYYNYSGQPECVTCGDTNIYNDGDLRCPVCDPQDYCYWCEERIHGEVYQTSDGHTLCEWCFDEHVVSDPIADRDVFEDCAVSVYLATTNRVEDLEEIEYDYCESIEIEENTDHNHPLWHEYFKVDDLHEVNGRFYILRCECRSRGIEIFNVYDLDGYIESDKI